MEKIIENLKSELKNIRILFVISSLAISTFVFLIISSIFSFIIIPIVLYLYFNVIWIKKAKNIIMSNIDKLLNNKVPSFKYFTDKKESKNLKIIALLRDILLFSNPNYTEIMNRYKSYKRRIHLNFEDEIILETNELPNPIEIIELTILDRYEDSKLSYVAEVEYFKGLVISNKITKPTNSQYPNIILIYHQNLLKNPENIDSYSINTSYKDFQNLNFKVINLQENIYCLYDINDENLLNDLKPKFYTIIENIYQKNNYLSSFIVFNQDIVYLFLNHKDYIFKSRDLFNVPPFFEIKEKELNSLVNNFKNQLEKILELVL